MASTSETGHAQNAANFSVLITNVKGYGEKYKPSNASITVVALETKATESQGAITLVETTEATLKKVSIERETAYEPLSDLTTRAINSLKSSGVDSNVIESAETPARKIKGQRANPKKTEEQKKAMAAEGKEVNEISTSQMSFDNRLDNLNKLTGFLSNVPEYKPNEDNIKLVSLKAMATDLETKNNATKSAATDFSNALINRNEILYKDKTGLYDLTIITKDYVKSVYTASSPQYKQLTKIKFTKPR